VYHILLIDANEFFAAATAALLRRMGYRVSTVPCLEDGCRTHAADPAELVLVGLNLGRAQARRDLACLETAFAGSRVLALVCERDRASDLFPPLLAALGPRRLFTKPFRTEDLLGAIQAELARPARRAC